MTYKYFTESELACSHCNQRGMNEQFMSKIESLREELGFPFIVTSGPLLGHIRQAGHSTYQCLEKKPTGSSQALSAQGSQGLALTRKEVHGLFT